MRLIDVDELNFDGMSITQIVDAVQDAPAIDAVEVVRCKDCRFLGDENLGLHDCDHHRGPMRVELDDFCSYGERKEAT